VGSKKYESLIPIIRKIILAIEDQRDLEFFIDTQKPQALQRTMRRIRTHFGWKNVRFKVSHTITEFGLQITVSNINETRIRNLQVEFKMDVYHKKESFVEAFLSLVDRGYSNIEVFLHPFNLSDEKYIKEGIERIGYDIKTFGNRTILTRKKHG
jgi:hypothetical protein